MLVHARRVWEVVVEPVVGLELSLRAGVHIAVSLVLEVNVSSHDPPVEILARPEVVPEPRLFPSPAVPWLPLAELLEQLQLLLADVDRLVHDDPGDGLPAPAPPQSNYYIKTT